MVLFQNELNVVHKASEQTVGRLREQNEVLRYHLSRANSEASCSPRVSTSSAPRLSTSSATLPPVDEQESVVEVKEHTVQTNKLGPMVGALLGVLLLAFSGSMISSNAQRNEIKTAVEKSMLEQPSVQDTLAALNKSGEGAQFALQNLHSALQVASAAGPPNIASAVLRQRDHGLEQLSKSDCPKAQWYFESALHMLREQEQFGNSSLTMPVDTVGLLGDRGFALVCANRYKDGARSLEEYFDRSKSKSPPTHLLNALGYARFHMKEFDKAARAFDAGLKADPLNSILWSNLAACKMVQGDLQGADDALYHAWDRAEGTIDDPEKAMDRVVLDDFQRHRIGQNVQQLACRSGGPAEFACPQDLPLPFVELWWGGERRSQIP